MPNNERRAVTLRLAVVGVAAVAFVGVGVGDVVAALAVGAVAAVVVAALVAAAAVSHEGRKMFKALTTKRDATAGTRRPLLSSRTVTGISRLLPSEVRDRYREEWAAWMSDMRADGTPRILRWIELLTIVLIAAPRLAIALRIAARRAVDR